MNKCNFLTFDQANSEGNEVWLDVVGGSSICIRRTDDGIRVDLLTQIGHRTATTHASWNELHDTE
jgi:hypothetical protein